MASWYSYSGFGSPLLPGSYSKMSVDPACIVGGIQVCAIYLNQTANVPPSIDTSVIEYITDALGTGVSQPATGKRFVYVKGL